MEENKDERLILGGSGVLDECERICSPQPCLQEILLKFHRWLHSPKAFYCIFPSPINSLYLHLCVGKYDCCCCLAQGWSRRELSGLHACCRLNDSHPLQKNSYCRWQSLDLYRVCVCGVHTLYCTS